MPEEQLLARDIRLEQDEWMQELDTPCLIRLFRSVAWRLEENRDHLCALDGEVGDGDHGTSMANGFAAVARMDRRPDLQNSTPDAYLRQAANVFLSNVGATVGPLYASALLQAAKLYDEHPRLGAEELDDLLKAFADGIALRGHAKLGDKTMLDAWLPAVRAAQEARRAGSSATDVARAAAAAAQEGAESTATMIASRGRAARLKERSLGRLDPGAVSASLMLAAVYDTLKEGTAAS